MKSQNNINQERSTSHEYDKTRSKKKATNPCELVRLSKLERREYEWYNSDEIITMLDALKGEPLYPLIKTTVILRRLLVLLRGLCFSLLWDFQ